MKTLTIKEKTQIFIKKTKLHNDKFALMGLGIATIILVITYFV